MWGMIRIIQKKETSIKEYLLCAWNSDRYFLTESS